MSGRPIKRTLRRGVRHIGVSGLVQHTAVAGADWRRAPAEFEAQYSEQVAVP